MKEKLIKMMSVLLIAVLFGGLITTSGDTVYAKTYRNRFVKNENGETYYYNGKGKKLKSRFYTTRTGNTYYFNKKGRMVKGWKKIDGEYYYFSEHGGSMTTKKSVDGIKIKKDGTIKLTDYNVDKIKMLKRAKKVMESITQKSDSKEVKLKKCFDWVMGFPYERYRTLAQTGYAKGWELTFAADIFDTGKGCCVSEASAFAFLARACGYKKVYVCNDTAHAWTEIDGYVYDPLFAEAKDYNSFYKASYSFYILSPAGGRVLV